MSDRTVHASGPQMEVVRYNKAGKWYLEPTDRRLPRQSVTIAEAVDYTNWLWKNGGTPHFDRPGGGRFDSLLRRCYAAGG